MLQSQEGARTHGGGAHTSNTSKALGFSRFFSHPSHLPNMSIMKQQGNAVYTPH